MSVVLGLLLALASTAALSWGFLAQHGAAAALPELSVRRPFQSLRLLFADRSWLVGFLTGIGGWVLYVAALALAPLSLVQATSAGGIGLLALLVQTCLGSPTTSTGVARGRRRARRARAARALARGRRDLRWAAVMGRCGGLDGRLRACGRARRGTAGAGARGRGRPRRRGRRALRGGRRRYEGGGAGRCVALVRPRPARLPRAGVRRAATRLPARRRARHGGRGVAAHERAPDRRRARALPRAAPRRSAWGHTRPCLRLRRRGSGHSGPARSRDRSRSRRS